MSQKKKIEQLKPFAYLLVIAFLWLVVPPILKTFLNTGFREFQAPLIWGQSAVRRCTKFWGLKAQSKNELIEALRDQQRVNAQYEVLRSEYESLQNQIKQFEAVLEIPQSTDFESVVCRVAQQRHPMEPRINYSHSCGLKD